MPNSNSSIFFQSARAALCGKIWNYSPDICVQQTWASLYLCHCPLSLLLSSCFPLLPSSLQDPTGAPASSSSHFSPPSPVFSSGITITTRLAGNRTLTTARITTPTATSRASSTTTTTPTLTTAAANSASTSPKAESTPSPPVST